MKAYAPALAVLLAAAPASAGHLYDVDDDYAVYGERCCVDRYVDYGATVYARPAPTRRVIVHEERLYSAAPEVYSSECTITRKYRPGYVRERIECDED